jgi:hypothetical protein
MPMGDTPPVLADSAPDWWSRESSWKIPLILMGVALFVAAILSAVFGFMRSSGAYKGALERARSSATVREALGSPIEAGLFVTGNIQVSGPSGTANLAIPIKGPKGKGEIYVEASKQLGLWHFRHMVVVVEANAMRIDLSESTQLDWLQGQAAAPPRQQ